MNTKLGFTATMLTVGLLTAPVLAADRDDYNAFSQAKTSLTQAIQTAEKAQGGQARAVDAEFDHDDGKSLYEIKVMSGDQVMTYHIDAVIRPIDQIGRAGRSCRLPRRQQGRSGQAEQR